MSEIKAAIIQMNVEKPSVDDYKIWNDKTKIMDIIWDSYALALDEWILNETNLRDLNERKLQAKIDVMKEDIASYDAEVKHRAEVKAYHDDEYRSGLL